MIEVTPKHIDEVGLLNSKRKLLVHITPAYETILAYQGFSSEVETTLQNSRFYIIREFKPKDIKKLKVYSEEVHFEREITITEVIIK